MSNQPTVLLVIFFTYLVTVRTETIKPPSSSRDGEAVTDFITTATDGNFSDLSGSSDEVTQSLLITAVNENDNNATCGDHNVTSCSVLDVSVTTEMPQNAKNGSVKPKMVPDTSLLKLAEEIEKFSKKETCTCDLQRRTCDINCCCDKDCTYENKLIFEQCEGAHNRVYDASFCKYSTYIYKNNTPYEWEVNQNGLFCIVKSNLPQAYSVHKKLSIKTEEEANMQKSNKYFWPTLEANNTNLKFDPKQRFYYGQNVWVVRNYSRIEALEIQDSFVTSACLSKRMVRFLENAKTKCAQTVLNEENKFLDLENYARNLTVIALPTLMNATRWNETYLKMCPKNVCVPIEAKLCDDAFENCSNLTEINRHKFECRDGLYEGVNSCKNLVRKIRYKFYHNGTRGIHKVEAFFVLGNETFDLRRGDFFLQEFEVVYFWLNYSLNYSSVRSGNPGYIVGKPVLTANLLSTANLKNGTVRNFTKTVYRNHPDLTDNFMVFPANKNGLCLFGNGTNTPVEFGYNMVLRCKVREKVRAKNLTAIRACAEIQEAIFRLWSVKVGNQSVSSNVSKVVGNFGNADASHPEDWTPVFFAPSPGTALNGVSGKFVDANATLFCTGVRTHLKVDLYHGREVVKNSHHQEKILWTTFRLENARNVGFDLIDGEIFLGVDLRMEVMFFDVTTEKIKKFADAPTFEIKLPYDFFYPFIKVGGSGVAATRNFGLTVLLWVFVFYRAF